MKHLFSFFLLFLTSFFVDAQVKHEMVRSAKLKASRQIKVQLPRGYKQGSQKSYPLFVVLDGDYMFELVAGNVDYYSYWEDMPEAIVVGVNQYGTREDDCLYAEKNSLPIGTGASFFEFIGLELMPYLERKYSIGDFKIAVGHGDTANFINYYLLKEVPLFKGYISISPKLAPNMLDYLPEQFGKLQAPVSYYLANTSNDKKTVLQMTNALNEDLSTINNDNIKYSFDNFDNLTKYTLPMHAIPNALENIFKIYQPITRKEYKEVILPLEISPVLYLQEKYESISSLFGIDKKIIINDFKAIAAAIEKNETFEYFEELGKMARKQYPSTLLGSYYIARFYEETGSPKKAMRTYQSAYTLDGIAGITKELMLEKAEAIKVDFGY